MKTFLFLMIEGGGNIPAQMSIARRLAVRGHDVHVLADRPVAPEAVAAGCRFHTFVHAPQHNMRDKRTDSVRDWEPASPLSRLRRVGRHVMFGPSAAYARDLLETIEHVRPDALAIDCLSFGGIIGAEKSGIPAALLLHFPFHAPAEGTTPFGLGLRPARGPLGRLRDRVLTAGMKRIFRFGLAPVNAARQGLGLAPLGDLLDQLHTLPRSLVLTSREYDFVPARLPEHVRYVGPQLDDPVWPEKWTPPWPADSRDPLVVVSLGSTYQRQEKTFAAIVDALGRLRVRGLATLGALDPPRSPTPPNVTVVSSAPHQAVLPLASAVICHGGHGTVMKALAHGLPVVVMPFGRDQNDNGARLEATGAGLSLSRAASPARIAAAVCRVLEEPRFRDAARRIAAAIARDVKEDRAVAEMEALADRHRPPAPHQPGGRHSESPRSESKGERRALVRSVVALAIVAAGAIHLAAQSTGIPQLRKQGRVTQLIVDGRPFLIRGGELGNSSASNLTYLAPHWAKLRALRLNTILAPVYWDLIEPGEGKFDFTLVDGLVAEARQNDLRLVLLWFGSWKNSMSCYAPAWVKKDDRRFPRSVDGSGRRVEILSPFSTVNRDADARAFAALMKRLRAIDGSHTVVMVQVENEIGMIPSARDHSPEASKLFAAPVPTELMQYLSSHAETLAPELRSVWTAAGARRSGTWTEVFGPGAAAEEIFMAWHFARFTQHVTAAGKAEYALPMFLNAALIRPGYQPGQYPSAGPLPHLIDVWRAGAPAVDFIAPDIYFPTFVEWTRRYVRSGNPLFIPEALRTPDASVNSLYAFATHDAIGFSPFAIESTPEPAAALLTASNDIVAQLTPLILEHQGKGTMTGLLQEHPDNRQPQQIRLNGYELNVSFERGSPPSLADGGAAPQPTTTWPAGGAVIATGPDEFLFAGIGVTVTFESTEPGRQAGILSVEEGRYADGKWENIRWLNGDETHQGRHLRLVPGRFSIQRIKLYRYRQELPDRSFHSQDLDVAFTVQHVNADVVRVPRQQQVQLRVPD